MTGSCFKTLVCCIEKTIVQDNTRRFSNKISKKISCKKNCNKFIFFKELLKLVFRFKFYSTVDVILSDFFTELSDNVLLIIKVDYVQN